MAKTRRELLKPKDYDIVMKDPPPNLRQVVYYVDEDEEIEPVKHPNPRKHRYSNNELATMIVDGFKDVNTRINQLETRIDTRLDYIVKANNLKDLPKTK